MTVTAEHTPGPWKWFPVCAAWEPKHWRSAPGYYSCLFGRNKETLVLTWRTTNDGKHICIECSPADAALIEAAPNLLEACERLYKLAKAHAVRPGGLSTAEFSELTKPDRAAIAAAKPSTERVTP